MKNRSAKLLLTVLGIAGVLLLGLGMPAQSQSEAFWNGTVIANVNLRKVPSLKGTIIKGLLKGSSVKIYEEKDGWFRVSAQKYHQVFKGWVSIEYVEIAAAGPSVATPVAEAPEPEPQVQTLPPAEGSVQPGLIEAPEKPLPTPVEETAPPEPASQPAVTPEPEPEKRVDAKLPETKVAATKPERSPRVKAPPVKDAAATTADDWKHMLPMALPVVAVVVLLIAVIAYRVKRAARKKTGEPAAPVEWPTPLDGGEQALKEQDPLEKDLSPSLGEALKDPFGKDLSPSLEEELKDPLEKDLSPSLGEALKDPFGKDLSPSLEEELKDPLEKDQSPSLEEELTDPFAEDSSPSIEEELKDPLAEDLSPSLEEELTDPFAEDPSPSLEEELNEPFEEDLSAALEEELGEPFEEDLSAALEEELGEPLKEDQGQPLEEVLAEGLDFQMDFTQEVSDTGNESDSQTGVASVYDQVVETINRMSDVELTELLGMVNVQQGEKSRQDDRLTFYCMVDFVVAGQYYRDFIQDLSASGVFIKGRHMFEPGQAILMTFMSPYFQKPFKISGEIVRILDTGIGVKFDTDSPVQAEALSALMKQIRMLEEEV